MYWGERRRKRWVIVRSRCIIPREDGSFLMQREKGGTYSLPGGRLEFQETLPFCAVRELREEAGIDVIPQKLVYIVETVNERRGYPRHEILFYFVCKYKGEPRREYKDIRYEWRKPREVYDNFWPPGLVRRLEEDAPEFNDAYFIVFIDDRLTFVNRLEGGFKYIEVKALLPQSYKASEDSTTPG